MPKPTANGGRRGPFTSRTRKNLVHYDNADAYHYPGHDETPVDVVQDDALRRARRSNPLAERAGARAGSAPGTPLKL